MFKFKDVQVELGSNEMENGFLMIRKLCKQKMFIWDLSVYRWDKARHVDYINQRVYD